jgi:hypothetical protein
MDADVAISAVLVGAAAVAVLVVVAVPAVVVVFGTVVAAVVVVVLVVDLTGVDTIVMLKRCLAVSAAAVSRVVSVPAAASAARAALSDWPPPQAVRAISELSRVRAWAARGECWG